MNQEDFERLKAVCEKEGFDITIESMNEAIISVKKKDVWEGVEFIEYIGHSWPTGQTIFKVLAIDNFDVINVIDGSKEGGHLQKYNCKPSTEKAYVEQLKKEAHERFGEIKECCKFEFIGGIPYRFQIGSFWKPVWNYRKDKDWLTFSGYTMYKQGKWATRVKERIKV